MLSRKVGLQTTQNTVPFVMNLAAQVLNSIISPAVLVCSYNESREVSEITF